MRIRVRRFSVSLAAISVLLLISCSASDGEVSSSAKNDLPTAQEILAAIEGSLSTAGVPGALVLVTDGQGAETLTLYGDSKSGRPVSAEDRFAFRSITKSLVGTVVLQLADEGELDIQAPVSDYLANVPNADLITIEQLATMRSGLANYSAIPSMGELLIADPEREPDIEALLIPAFAASPVFKPGSAYEYSNTNTLLLGQVITAVTDDDWMTAVEQRLLAPLEMTHTEYGFTGAPNDATGYQLENGQAVEELPTVAPGFFGAAGALTGTVHDLAIWGEALGSGALLEPETQRYRIESLGSVSDDPASPHYDSYGFAVGELFGWVGHTGNGLGFQALTMHDPSTHRTVAIMLNGTGENPDLPADVFGEVLELL